LQSKYSQLILDVRGKGLMIGVQISRPGREIVNRCLEEGYIINCTAGEVLRFVPPLNINKNHIDELIVNLDKVFAEFC